ncbi:MAG: hypothetical protein [Trichoderma harzianum mononegavirus 1]|nr:MAG: hypothetical protein [Trichoderma harzianum mononegavirus 1]
MSDFANIHQLPAVVNSLVRDGNVLRDLWSNSIKASQDFLARLSQKNDILNSQRTDEETELLPTYLDNDIRDMSPEDVLEAIMDAYDKLARNHARHAGATREAQEIDQTSAKALRDAQVFQQQIKELMSKRSFRGGMPKSVHREGHQRSTRVQANPVNTRSDGNNDSRSLLEKITGKDTAKANKESTSTEQKKE